MTGTIRNKFIITAVLAIACSCASTNLNRFRNEASKGQAWLVEGVPFVKQKEFMCGPAVVTMVLRYHGIDVSHDEVANQVYLPQIQGSPVSEMKSFIIGQGLRAREMEGGMEDIRKALEVGLPVIALISPNGQEETKVQHFVVITGYSPADGMLLMHSGSESDLMMDETEFKRRWKRHNNWMLVVSHRSKRIDPFGNTGPRP
jgi:ABC-type bacteriocin/lantibiotic exporter with double-glycine peptidase domain